MIPADRYDAYPGRALGERVAHVLVDGVGVPGPGRPRRAAVLDRLACESAALAHPEPGWDRGGPGPDPTRGGAWAPGFMRPGQE